jgi:SAM-dependent methyltransferase
MDQDPTRRFSVRVDAYARHRPTYPAEVAALAERECGLRAGCSVADIGCGTGLLARLFLDRGCYVFGVEPNPEMRDAGQKALAGMARFQAIDGRAEATTLPAASVDLVTAGQAAHWFDADLACAEFRRILKPGGWLMLVWNERKRQAGFMSDYEALIARHAPEKPRIDTERIARLFGGAGWRMARFDHQQTLDARRAAGASGIVILHAAAGDGWVRRADGEGRRPVCPAPAGRMGKGRVLDPGLLRDAGRFLTLQRAHRIGQESRRKCNAGGSGPKPITTRACCQDC